jgi:riboflavin synthase
MFTGIVTDLGRVRAVEGRGERRFTFATGYPPADLSAGASVACSGACLTVVAFGKIAELEVPDAPDMPDMPDARSWFAADVSAETLSKTTLGEWRVGTPVNFERALRLGDELGGHLVSGHVDGQARVVERRPEGGSHRFAFTAAADLAPFIAPKGSIALDGVSLTVNEVADVSDGGCRFGVNIIPHTAAATTFGTLAAGDAVNLEIDMVARYLRRLLESRS